MSTASGRKRPAIHMIGSEADSLYALAMSIEAKSPEVARMLTGEIDRAKIHAADKIPSDVITMMSRVEFVDEASGKTRELQLVWPRDANMDENRLSVLSLVGAGLIGLKEGQTITWPDIKGHTRNLRIAKVEQAHSLES